jgi:PAS domain S-box-containing protein
MTQNDPEDHRIVRSRALERVNDGIVALDTGFRYTYVNRQAERILGKDGEELRGRRVWNAFPETTGTVTEEKLRAAMETQDERSFERRNPELDRWFHVRVYPDESGLSIYFTDITERKERRRELERANQRLNGIIEASPLAIMATDPDGTVTMWNDAAEDIFGWSADEVIGELNPVVPDDRQSEFARLREAAMAENQHTGVELQRQRKDGELIDISLSTAGIPGPDGSVTEILTLIEDISDRKASERALKESERSLRKLYEITADTDRQFDEKLAEVLELGRERLDVEYGFLTRIRDDTQHIVQALGSHEKLRPGRSGPLSEAYCRKTVQKKGLLAVEDAVADGWEGDPAHEAYELGCYLGGKVVVDGSLHGTLCFADDAALDRSFTEGERAFVKLLVQWIGYEHTGKQFEDRLRSLQRTAGDLMLADSTEAVGEIAVSAARDILDLEVTGIWQYDEREEALVRITETEQAREVVGPSPRFEPGEGLAWEVFESGETATFEDVRTADEPYDPDTDIRAEIIVPLADQGVMSTGSTSPREFGDTDVGMFELLASTARAALQRVDRERKLQRKNDRLDEFTGIVAHDLRNPITAAMAQLEIYRETGDEDRLDDLDGVLDRMVELVDDLLVLARQGEPIADTESVGLRSVAEQAWDYVDTGSGELVFEDDLKTLSADPSRLTQLFENLFRNSVEHGGPDVRIGVGGYDSVFYVEDDGPGIPEDQRESVFEHGYTSQTEGTGFGLAIVEGIAEAHGWSVRATDGRDDGGARFEFDTDPVD